MYLNSPSVSDVYFELPDDFIDQYKGQQPDWGPIGYVTYKRTYARRLEDGGTEEFWQTVKRVVEGTFTVQKRYCIFNNIPWKERKAKKSAKIMYEKIWGFKFLPPGRGIWMAGTDYVFEKTGAPLNNCGFCSTKDIDKNFAEPFTFLMDMSMLGVGVGGSLEGAGKVTIQEPKVLSGSTYRVHDSREGWVDLVERVLNSYVGDAYMPEEIDYSNVRDKGEPIETFGGVSSGSEPLEVLIDELKELLDRRVGEPIQSTDIVDIFNLIGKCVVSGGIRRTAEIMLGDPNDEEFLDAKDPEKHPEKVKNHRWASNNSVYAEVGMDYSDVAERTANAGEPGYFWLENAREYSRMKNKPDNKDRKVMGCNPCVEQSLNNFELCCLVETFPANHETLDEWQETLKYAYMYGKTTCLIPIHNKKTNEVMNRNQRIGCSMSGIVQAFEKFGRRQLFDACDEGYDKIQHWDKTYSDWLGVPRSIKTTSVKPSGTTSRLPGATSGMHYPISKYYIRNVRFQEGSDVLDNVREAGFPVEEAENSDNTYVASFPVEKKHIRRTQEDVSMWEQLEIAAQLQKYWSDNQVSATITFDPETEAEDIQYALELYEDQLKGVSFLPKEDHGYEQAPYIPISEEEYLDMVREIDTLELDGDTHEVTDKFCSGESCKVDLD